MSRLCIILLVILALGWAPAGAQAEDRELSNVSGEKKKKRLEALKAQVAAERAELAHLREKVAHAKRKVSRATSGDIGVDALSAGRGAVDPSTNTSSAAGSHAKKALRSSHASDKVVQALASKAAREEEARVIDDLRIQEAKPQGTNPTAVRRLRVKSLVSLPDTKQLLQAVVMKLKENELAEVKDVSAASAQRKLQIQEAKDFLAAAQEDFSGDGEEVQQFLSAALESLNAKDGDDKEAAAVSEDGDDKAVAAKAPETQAALEAREARASLVLRKLRAEKAREKARLLALKEKLRKAKKAIIKVREATARVKQISHELPTEPLEPLAASIGLARMSRKARSASEKARSAALKLSKAHELASVAQKLAADKAAEQRAVEQTTQSHKKVLNDLEYLQMLSAKLVDAQQHNLYRK